MHVPVSAPVPVVVAKEKYVPDVPSSSVSPMSFRRETPSPSSSSHRSGSGGGSSGGGFYVGSLHSKEDVPVQQRDNPNLTSSKRGSSVNRLLANVGSGDDQLFDVGFG